MLQVEGLSAGYGGIPVLDGVGLTVGDGALTGILGHNGMGKSTLLKALMGILPATSGQITLDGANITGLSTDARNRLGLGYVPQGREIFPALSVADNLRFAAAAKGQAVGEAVAEILAEFPRLEPLLDRPGGALSGGEQQLLALARCLVQRPKLVLLDEPTEGIQPSIIQQIGEVIRHLRSQGEMAIILVEQYFDFAYAIADRVFVLERGAVVKSGDKAELGREELLAAVSV